MRLLYVAIVRLTELIELAIFIRVILSWIPNIKGSQIVKLLYQITEPVLSPIRSIIDRSAIGRNSMIDFSPVIAFLLLDIIKSVLARALQVETLFF